MQSSPSSPYIRGDGAAAAYLDMRDKQGRTFRKWADKHHLPFSLIGDGIVRTYRRTDIDRLWGSTGFNMDRPTD